MLLFVIFVRGRVRGPELLFVIWFFFLLAQFPLVILHEAGHLIAARIAGVPAYAVVVGGKPWLLDRPFLGIRWRIGRYPSGGVTYHAPCEGRHALAKDVWVTAAGPVANLLIAVVAFAVAETIPAEFDHSLTKLALLVTGFASAIQFIGNLWPREVNSIAGRVPNDGARIRNLLRGQIEEPRLARGARHYFRAWFAFEDRKFETAVRESAKARARFTEPHFVNALTVLGAAAMSESDDARGAVEQLRPLLPGVDEDPGLRSTFLDNLGWAYLLLDEPELLESGILLVAEACAIAPWEESYAISLACLFAASATAENDRVNDARELLSTLRLQKLTRQNAAYAALAQGLCAAAEGDAVVARRHYNDAKSRGATVAPLRLLERRLASI